MKTKFFFFITLLLMAAACRHMEIDDPTYSEEKPEIREESADSVWTLTIEATKGEPDTKALDLVNEGSRLNFYWKVTETVKVYKGGSFLGTLNVSPAAGEKPVQATLGGSITTTGLAQGDALTLLIPRDVWDYTGQNGALTGTGSIEDTYAYATAMVTVNSISGNTVSTTEASFSNQESIYRFGFKVSGSYIDPKAFTVSAAGGQLVQCLTLDAGVWTPEYGSLTVTPASAPADHFYYVSLRNRQTTDDTYSFIITGADDKLYMASKGIPASVLDAPGKFISAKNINAVQPDFSPTAGTTDTAL